LTLRSKNRTHRTDANRNVLEQHSKPFEIKWLEAARDYGVPSKLLEPGGWAGDENNLEGWWAEAVYLLGDALASLDRNPKRCNQAIWMMSVICDKYSIDRAAIPYEARTFLKSFDDARKRRAAIDRGDELPAGDEILGIDTFGAPSGDDHDSHGHGLSQGTWKCLGA